MEDFENIIEEIVGIVDNSAVNIDGLIEEIDFEVDEDFIKYEDFIELVNQNGNFKEIFENIMFSTTVLISKKDDFVDFVDKLIENGFTDISIGFIIRECYRGFSKRQKDNFTYR